MNILLLNHYAGSPKHGMEYRPYYLAREWVRAGHEVTVVAASFSHLRTQQPAIDRDWTEENIDGIRCVWLKTPKYQGNGVRRVWNMVAFVRQFRRHEAAILGVHRPDAVIASSPHPFVVFPARRVAAKYGAKLVFEVRDLWPLTLIDLSGMSRWHPFIQSLQFTENYAYRHADRIVSVLPKVDLYLREHGVDPAKFACVPNGIDIDEIAASLPLPEEHAAAISQQKALGRFLVGYVGQHGLSNALDAFVESASLLESANVALVLVGQGPEKARLEAKAREQGAKNIVFLPPVAKKVVPAVLAQMDALFLGWNRQPLYRYGISPNKLMDYMLAGKPVIHAVEAGNDPVVESACGISCEPENSVAVVESVRKLLDCSEEERRFMGQRGRDHVIGHFSYEVLAKRFLDVIEQSRPDSLTPSGANRNA
jgi:glycosyltransferase involved in cell wall biosynthesis